MLAGETTPLGASETGFRADPSTRLTNPASDHFNSGRIGDRRWEIEAIPLTCPLVSSVAAPQKRGAALRTA